MKEFTFLIPCLNEERSLGFCINEIKTAIQRLNLDAEILVADNGSTDNSKKIAAENGARLINVEKKGYGAALLGGINAAEGRYIIMADADGSYDFGHPELFIKALHEGYSLVVGNRFAGGIEKGAMPFSHRIGVPFLSILARLRFHAPIGDFHCGLRAFDAEYARKLRLKCPGMEFATEIIAEFAADGAKICEVPTILRKDIREGKPHLRTIRDGFRHLYFICFKKPI